MRNTTVPKRLEVDVAAALRAICSTGKGCCWYCDARLPGEREAIENGWDVQRVEDHAVASIILICPSCLREGVTDEVVRRPAPRPAPGYAPVRRVRRRRAAQPA